MHDYSEFREGPGDNLLAQIATTALEQKEAEAGQDMNALKVQWGANYASNMEQGRRAARTTVDRSNW